MGLLPDGVDLKRYIIRLLVGILIGVASIFPENGRYWFEASHCAVRHREKAWEEMRISSKEAERCSELQGKMRTQCWADWTEEEELGVLDCGQVYHERCLEEWF